MWKPVLRRQNSDPHLYRAGERAAPGVYQEIERGITVRLAQAMPLPDLNSYQPGRFFRIKVPGPLLRWLRQAAPTPDPDVLYPAGQTVLAGCYQDVERGVVVNLRSDGPLPDLQSREPSRYRRLRAHRIQVRSLLS